MDIFICDVSNVDGDRLIKAATVLSQTEKARLQNMISVKRQHEFILGHFLLRKAVSQITGKPLNEVNVESLTSGALCLPDNPGLFASLSHSYGKVAIGIAHQPVGIDIEWMRHKENLPELLAQIDGVKGSILLQKAGASFEEAFFEMWCRREARYKLKSLGSGVAFEYPFFYCRHGKGFMFCAATTTPEIFLWRTLEI